MNRLEWLKKRYTGALKKHGETKKPSLTVDDFMRHDPSRNKSHCGWMIETYLSGGFLAEDLSKVTETLILFTEHQKRLDVSLRDHKKFNTLADMWEAISPFVTADNEDLTPSGKEMRRREKAMAYEQSIILVDEPDFKVAIPTTKFAAQWWGKGTRWCTAADKDNAFHLYHMQAPLIVFTLPNGRKLQLHVTKDDFQFMNEYDAPVKIESLGDDWGKIKSFMDWAMEIRPSIITKLPRDEISQEMWLSAIKKNPALAQRVRDQEFTKELAENIVQYQGWLIEFIPYKFKTKKLWQEAALKSPHCLADMPVEYYTYEICEKAVKKDGAFIEIIPEELIDYDICLAAVIENADVISKVPARFLDENICRVAFIKDASIIGKIPQKYVTYELCLEAVQNNPRSLAYIPEEFKTYEMCFEAVKKHGFTLSVVPSEHLNIELCMEAVKDYPLALQDIPPSEMSIELWREAVRKNFNALDDALRAIKDEKIAYEICLEAVNANGMALANTPQHLRTQELCDIAVIDSPIMLKYVPEELQNYEMCMRAVEKNISAVKHVAYKFVNEELLMNALRKNKRALSTVMHFEAKITSDMCLEAIEINQESFYSIPEHLVSEVYDKLDEFMKVRGIAPNWMADKEYMEKLQAYVNRMKPAQHMASFK